jgi:uncharacterized membrane protein
LNTRWLLAIFSLIVFAGFWPSSARAEPGSPVRDIAKEVRAVFAAKCAACHGPDLVKPKGRFGYVLDLRRVAENPEFVIPLRPAESELWELVQRNEMPPPDSPHGPLTFTEKETIREWIAAGAPDVLPGPALVPRTVGSEPMAPAATEPAAVGRLLGWLGKFHLLLLHFPIALVVGAGVGELWSIWRRNPLPSESVRFCLWLAACAVIPTAILGWLFAAAGNGIGSPQLLATHRWLGTTAAVWLVIMAVCAEGDARRQMRSRRVRLLLITGILVTALTAHLGGLLAHGEDFFTY